MADVIGAALLVSALALAPFIGGGLGELTGGVLQVLVFGGIGLRLLLGRKESGGWTRVPGMWFVAAFAVAMIASTLTTHCLYFSLTQLLFTLACLGAYVLGATVCRDKRIAAAAVWALVISAMLASGTGHSRIRPERGRRPELLEGHSQPGRPRAFVRAVRQPQLLLGFPGNRAAGDAGRVSGDSQAAAGRVRGAGIRHRRARDDAYRLQVRHNGGGGIARHILPARDLHQVAEAVEVRPPARDMRDLGPADAALHAGGDLANPRSGGGRLAGPFD